MTDTVSVPRHLLEALVDPRVDDLLDNARLIIMTQNPAHNHHWDKPVAMIAAGDLKELTACLVTQ